MQTKYRVRDVEAGEVVAYEYIDSANRWAWFPVDDPAVRPLEGTYPHSGIREQFTGSLDKNGVEVYKADILSCLYSNDGCEHTWEVIYDEDSCRFWLSGRGECQQQRVRQTLFDSSWLEVIGSIHDKEAGSDAN